MIKTAVERFSWYISTWQTIILRPIYFYVKFMDGKWSDNPLTFLLFSSWIFSFLLTLVIFIAMYVPIGATLLVKVHGIKLLLVSPIIIAIGLDFFVMTLFLIGGIMMVGFLVLFFMLAGLLKYVFKFIFSADSDIFEMAKAVFYSSAVLLFFGMSFFLVLPLKYGILTQETALAGLNVFMFLALVYGYGLWAIGAKRVTGTNKIAALAGATIPFLAALGLQVVVALKVLPKFLGFLG